MASLPQVQVLHKKYAKNPNVVILAMNVGDENERVVDWWKEKKYEFRTLHDADKLASTYGIKAFPSSVLIDPNGKVVRATVGSAYVLEAELQKALEGASRL